MIIIKPDNKIKKRFTHIDFRTLSLVYSLLFDNVYKVKKKRVFNLNLKLTTGMFSYYRQQRGSNIRINISELIFDDKQFHITLLHEFRHFVQDKALHIPWTRKFYDDRTAYKYMMSPVEIDADNYSLCSASKVVRLYNRM